MLIKKRWRSKPKVQKTKIPRVNGGHVNRKSARFLFFGFFILLLLSVPLTWVKANAIAQTNAKLQKQLKAYASELDDAKSGTVAYNPLLAQMLTGFVNAYANTNQSDTSKRISELKKYVADGVDVSTLLQPSGSQSQSLKSARLSGIYVENGVKVAQMETTYEVNDGKGGTTSQTSYLNIPYATKNGIYTVAGYPFVSQAADPVGKITKFKPSNFDDESKLKLDQTQAVNEFVKTFLKKYAESSASDMSMSMNDPAGLEGKYTVDDVMNQKVTGTVDHPHVTGEFTLTEAATGISHKEYFDLKLTKQSKTYFVNKFGH